MVSQILAKGWQRRGRISKFKHRDRHHAPPVYAAAPAPATLKFTTWNYAPSASDCLGKTLFSPTSARFPGWVVATIASPGYEQQADEFFTTLARFGEIPSAKRILLAVEPNADLLAVAAKHGAICVPLRATGDLGPWIKAALYSISRIVHAQFYLCCDSDVFVVEDLRPLLADVEKNVFQVHAATSAPTMCDDNPASFQHTARHYYDATPRQIEALADGDLLAKFRRLNSGIFAGHSLPMMCLDIEMRNHAAQSNAFIAARTSPAADELCFSLAVARLGGVAEISKLWNLQLYADDVAEVDTENHTGGNWPVFEFWHGDEKAKILHFAGAAGRAKMPGIRQLLELEKAK